MSLKLRQAGVNYISDVKRAILGAKWTQLIIVKKEK